MITALWLVGFIVLLLFGFVIFFGAPYLPTMRPQIKEALSMLRLCKGEILLELGSGDGKVLKAAAEQGIHAVGIELNPVLVLYSLWNTRKYRPLVKVHWGNFWTKQLPDADGIYVFLHTRFMRRLDKKITQEISRPVKLVSYAFPIPDKKCTKEQSGMFLYTYRPLASRKRVK